VELLFLVVVLMLPLAGTALVVVATGALRVPARVKPTALVTINAAAFASVLALDLGRDSYYDDGTRYVDRGPVGPVALVVLAGITVATMLVAFRRAGCAGDRAAAVAFLAGGVLSARRPLTREPARRR